MDYNDAIIDGEFTAFCKEDKANNRLSIKMSPKKGRKSSFRPRLSGVFYSSSQSCSCLPSVLISASLLIVLSFEVSTLNFGDPFISVLSECKSTNCRTGEL
jgi:hypothetical protein